MRLISCTYTTSPDYTTHPTNLPGPIASRPRAMHGRILVSHKQFLAKPVMTISTEMDTLSLHSIDNTRVVAYLRQKKDSGCAYPRGFLRPTRLRMRLTFFGDMERRAATRETLPPSRSQTLGITSSANSSLICWKVLSPTDPCDQARSSGVHAAATESFRLQRLQVFPGAIAMVALGQRDDLVVAMPRRVRDRRKSGCSKSALAKCRYGRAGAGSAYAWPARWLPARNPAPCERGCRAPCFRRCPLPPAHFRSCSATSARAPSGWSRAFLPRGGRRFCAADSACSRSPLSK